MASPLPTYEEAIEIIRKQTSPLGRIACLEIADAVGMATSATLVADEPYPRFDNSAVDGYVVGRLEDGRAGASLRIGGAIAAGALRGGNILPGTAKRILTGAPVPPNAFGVVMQEDVVLVADSIALLGDMDEGDNIRRLGTEIRAGQELVRKGTPIDAGVASLFALTGQVTVDVFQPPTVAAFTTGDELVDPVVTPTSGQIRDTNSVMLDLLVRQATGAAPTLARVEDDLSLLMSVLDEASTCNDLILIAGGASVGDRDFVAEAVNELGEIYFHGVSIRPGKPILFGRIGQSLVFGLPGNPASVFVGFHIFVQFAIRALAGWRCADLVWIPIKTAFPHRAVGRADFPRVHFEAGLITMSKEQGSFGLTSPAYADAIAMFPADVDTDIGYQCPTLRIR